jgi:5-methylcytosine-specific restriction endonuclease McrA
MSNVWIDQFGRFRKVPSIRGRLKTKIPLHRDLKEFVIFRDGALCKQCGSTENLIADHVASRSNGGSHHPDNLQCLCQSCNSRKSVLFDRKFQEIPGIKIDIKAC